MTDAAASPAVAADLLNGSTPPSAFEAAEAVNARAEINAKKSDPEFYKTLKAEKERGVSGPASQAWDALHKTGYPAPTGAASQSDVDAQASARVEKEWGTFFAGLRTMRPITPEQEIEMRTGVIREDLHRLALEQRDLMVKDKAFYRRLLDGDMAAKEKWGRIIAAVGLRPVKAP
ncbi:MAG: hypothetical protein WCB33_00900 [Bradyrhizobium sp.]|uniref:hypothetical protein n=2 Tax=Bradyrhizobium sp. TaxID=376 RepID=UPI003BAF3549